MRTASTKGRPRRPPGPGPRITPAAPLPPAGSTSSWQPAPPIDYTQCCSDQPECASVPRLHAHPPIIARSSSSFFPFQLENPLRTAPPSPRPPPYSPIIISHPAQGRCLCTLSNQRGCLLPPSPTTPALREQWGAVSPRPLLRPPISAHARCVPNQPLLSEVCCSGPVSQPHLSELLCSSPNTSIYLDSTLSIMHFSAEQNFNDLAR